MTPFEYRAAQSLPEALEWLADLGDDAHLMAGGTSMIPMMRTRLLEPAVVIGLREIAELRGIRRDASGWLEIGALETHRHIERSADVRAHCPALAETFGHVATVRIRNQGTIGGNLVHADPAQDPPPMLLALEAEVVIAGPSGERTVPLAEFFTDYFETALQPGEILKTVRVPPLSHTARAAYVKFLPQSQDDYATVSVAAVLDLDGQRRCTRARVALGAVGSIPIRAYEAEAALEGQALTDALVDDIAAALSARLEPFDDVRGSASYKREMARVWAGRALRTLAAAN